MLLERSINMKAILLFLVTVVSANYYESDSLASASDTERSGFVTPIDFSPIFGSESFGLSGVASTPVKNVLKLTDGSEFLAFPSSDVEIFSNKPSPQFQSLFDTSVASTGHRFTPFVGAEYKDGGEKEGSQRQYQHPFNSGKNTEYIPSKPTKASPAPASHAVPNSQYRISSEFNPAKVAYKSKGSKNYNYSPSASSKSEYSYGAVPSSNSYLKPSASQTAFQTQHADSESNSPSANLKNNPNCKVIKSDSKDTDSTCYKCKDKSGNYYEQCSYTSAPNGKSYYSGSAESYRSGSDASPSEQTDYRYRRQTDEYKYRSKPSEFDSKPTYRRPEFEDFSASTQHDQSIGPDYSEEYEKIKKQSEEQAKEIKLNPKNCKKVVKKDMTCHVCADQKTGGSYESCSYVSQPKSEKYAFTNERKFNSNDEPEEKGKSDKNTKQENGQESTKVERGITAKQTRVVPRIRPLDKSTKREPQISTPRTSSKYRGLKKHEDRFDTAASTENRRKSEDSERPSGGQGLDPFLYGKAESLGVEDEEKNLRQTALKDYEHYFTHLFPEYKKQSKDKSEKENEEEPEETNTEQKSAPAYDYKSSLPDFFTNNEPKKDVEKVLAEFAKKDRTDCKKVIKDKLTCYQCVDDKGTKHEECMFVAASEPKSSHLAYHEVKQFQTPNKPEAIVPESSDGQESVNKETVKSRTTTKKTRNPKASELDSNSEYSSKDISKVSTVKPEHDTKTNRRNKKRTIVTRNARVRDSVPAASSKSEKVAPVNNKEIPEQPEPPTPAEFIVEGSDGAFAADLEPQYSEDLGITLPKYMLERTEQEAEFDEVLKSGR